MRCEYDGWVVRIDGKLSERRSDKEIKAGCECPTPETGCPDQATTTRLQWEAYQLQQIERCRHIEGGLSGDGDGAPLKDFDWVDRQGFNRRLTVDDQRAQAGEVRRQIERRLVEQRAVVVSRDGEADA